jgi:hypothetical protein
MIEEFKKIKSNGETRFVLEFSDTGVTGSTSIASVEKPIGELQSRTEPPKPRNFVAKNAKMGGAGKMKDKSKTLPRKEKHKKPFAEGVENRQHFIRHNIWTVMDGDEEVLQHTVEGDPFFSAKKFIRDLDDQGYEFTHVVSPEGKITYLPHLDPRNFPKDEVDEDFNGEYDDEAGMAHSNLLTTARAVQGLLDTIKDRDNLPEWAQEKIAKAEMMLVSVWDYLQSQKEMGVDPQQDMEEARTNYHANTTGFSRGPRDDERHDLDTQVDPREFRMYNLTIDGKPLNPQPIMGRSNLIKFGKQQAAAGVDLSNAMISLVDEGVAEGDVYMESLAAKLEEKIAEDAKVDRQAKHITKSMMKAHPSMSKDDAESAAWAHIKHPKKNKK